MKPRASSPSLARPALPLALVLASAAACAGSPSGAPASAAGASSPGASATSPGEPGRTQGAEPVVEELHGVKVADPFRWLEDGDSPAVKAWTAAQAERTRRALDAIPLRATLLGEAQSIFRGGGEASAPAVVRTARRDAVYFHTRRAGEEDQPILYVRDGARGADRVLIDPSKLGGGGAGASPGRSPVALDWWYPSLDGAYVTYGYSQDGTELSTLHVRDVKTGADLPDAIPYTRYATVAWVPDGKGFYYARFPEPGTVPAGEEQKHQKIFFHLLGNAWKSDRLIYEPASIEDHPGVSISPRGRWLVLSLEKGFSRNEIYVRDRSRGTDAKWVPVVVGVDALTTVIPREERLYLLTNDGAPNDRLFSMEYDHPARALWREVIKEGKDALDAVTILRGEIVATYVHEASSRLERFALNGKSKGALALPSIGTATVTGPWDGDEAFVQFESFVDPPRVLRFEAASGKLEPWDGAGGGWVSDAETTVKYATSKDGTKVPIFVVARKGTPLGGDSGPRPALLWGYGGFESNQTPTFRPYAVLTLEHGGVFATAVLRGGAEFGEAWHRAGMLGNKQNVFDDYAACARELSAEKITSADRLVSIGRSNGGLLVAAAVTQDPELFRAGVAIVPLTDMVRYPRFGIGSWWTPEYGDPAKEEDFRWLYAYSPYHHVKDGARYPAVLLSTGESDNRVDPMHSRKMAARLEEAQGDKTRPILLRVDLNAGHGQGKPASKFAEQLADEMAFALDQAGVSATIVGPGADAGGDAQP